MAAKKWFMEASGWNIVAVITGARANRWPHPLRVIVTA